MQEMHNRASHRNGSSTEKSTQSEQEKNAPPAAVQTPMQNSGKNTPSATPDLPFNIQELFAEKDRNLILIMILLLLGEHSDTSLIMALVYLIL